MSILGFLQDDINARTPKFLRNPNIARFLETVGFMLDLNVQSLAEGFRLSNPLKCDPSAFPSLSRDRKIRLYPNEPEASKRYRLSRWRQIRRHDGSAYGAMINLQPYFLPGVLPTIRIVHQSGDPGTGAIATWHTLSPAGVYTVYSPTVSNFDYDGHPEKWSRWWAFIYMAGTGLAPPPTYDDGSTYDGGAVYDGPGLSAGQINDIATLLQGSNPPHAWLAGVALVWPPGDIDPTGTPTQDADGRWSLPNGANTWASTVDPTTGKATRPANVEWIYDNPAP